MSEAYNIYVVKHHVKTHNLADTLAQIEREGISYAEWQKRQYEPYYDVRSTIKLDIAIMVEQSLIREYEKSQKKDMIDIFEKCRKRSRVDEAKEKGISETVETNPMHLPFKEIENRAKQMLIDAIENIIV